MLLDHALLPARVVSGQFQEESDRIRAASMLDLVTNDIEIGIENCERA
jgi:hypothetical protein